jgi:uncharacterized protein (DUF924 family)
MTDQDFSPDDVLDFWFPDDGHWESVETHVAFWEERMRGGMDDTICRDFGPVAEAAARCQLDHWADTPRGRLALLIALDQFPRSLWRDTPAAFGQDIKATRLALEGIGNGHYEALTAPWERQFYIIAISHCEGPDHLDRMDLCIELSKAQADLIPDHMGTFADRPVAQSQRVRGIIERFGRHPHRNPIYGRPSSLEEEAYIAEGDFPHQGKIEVKTG